MAVAVSGGADSFALLQALWAKGYSPVALSVEHGLRAEARAEAETVAIWCAARDIPHRILPWDGDKPSKGIQAAARTARYRLLIEACTEQKIGRLLTGHTLDDQAEALFKRLRRGSGAGLAAMRPRSLVAAGPSKPLRLLRPMLKTTRREETARYAADHDLPVAADPSNEDDRFERIQVRGLLRALELQDLLAPTALARAADRVAALAEAQERRLSGLFETVGLHPLPGVVHLDFDKARVDADDQRALVARAMSAIGTPIQADEVALHEGQWAAGGVIVEKERERVAMYREPAAMVGRADGAKGLEPMAVAAAPVLWDQRYILTPPADVGPGAQWAPLGQGLPNQIVTSTRLRRELAGVPALFQGGRVTHVPKWALSGLVAALDGWKDAGSFLSPLVEFEAESLLKERFAGRVIRH